MDTRTTTAHDLARRSLLLMQRWDDERSGRDHPPRRRQRRGGQRAARRQGPRPGGVQGDLRLAARRVRRAGMGRGGAGGRGRPGRRPHRDARPAGGAVRDLRARRAPGPGVRLQGPVLRRLPDALVPPGRGPHHRACGQPRRPRARPGSSAGCRPARPSCSLGPGAGLKAVRPLRRTIHLRRHLYQRRSDHSAAARSYLELSARSEDSSGIASRCGSTSQSRPVLGLPPGPHRPLPGRLGHRALGGP